MPFTPPHGPPVTFGARLHDARTATVIGRLLGLAVLVCFATGVLSHYLQHPPPWLADRLPSRPYWGYRLTQGLHVASGIAAIPLLLAKLWTVYPRLFARPPVRSVRHALERLSVAVLVAAGIFELFTGLLNTFQWYPWPFSFVPVHYAVAWLLLGAMLLHVAVQWPRIREHFTRRSPGTLALPEADGPDRRQLLAAVAAGVGAVTLATVGQSVTVLGPAALFAPRSPAHGPQGLPVNRTAAAARVTEASLADWRLTLAGPRPYSLTLAELRALPQHEVTLPIACVEGWSKSARWTGVRVRDLLERAGAGPDARCRVVSMEAAGAYRVMEMGRLYAQDPLTLLALRLNGEVLSLDHGYPARIIAPNRPGVLQTKWVGRLEVV
ncbi:molybdopterin-dependent oxidoreductase [Streptomyces avidinii]|uniref:DMSO/TMAO reductase YedYZ molybdopterin-dependent catalytic subunit n=1 Tax=Streptomyces avidinii TaxID=1895 RepID=A0ABS4L542_STRAV|nr:molybdopterin-dependent oxidoreductase [Streptomyces avidinii]MBP2037234.1 DMSO/TMAO reductase YedYZ molybdopterin-dependent catalytic subunit [Streptomyces avidinii]GGY96197.1 molybdopterin-binding protein [Streptomyces avidinii]